MHTFFPTRLSSILENFNFILYSFALFKTFVHCHFLSSSKVTTKLDICQGLYCNIIITMNATCGRGSTTTEHPISPSHFHGVCDDQFSVILLNFLYTAYFVLILHFPPTFAFEYSFAIFGLSFICIAIIAKHKYCYQEHLFLNFYQLINMYKTNEKKHDWVV